MKKTTLFQLGGIALILSAILYSIGNLIYFMSGQPDAPMTPILWLSFFGDTLNVLGLGVLFARQSQRGGLLGFIGYVSLVFGTMFFIGNYAVSLGLAANVFTNEQIAQVPAYVLPIAIMPWIWRVGLIIFGVSIYRAQVLPRYAGVLLVLQVIMQQFWGSLAIAAPIVAVIVFVVWTWLGWSLIRENSVVSPEAVPAT
jgi:hypothetical protein